MKTYRIRVYEDMYLLDDGTGSDTKVVELGQLEATLFTGPPAPKVKRVALGKGIPEQAQP